jgi:integrase
VLTASPYRGEGRSYVDLKHGIFYRLAEGSRETNKRQPPVPLPPRLRAHLRRWFSNGLVHEYFVEWNGKPVQSVKTAFKTALRLAGIQGRVTPHTLRHTAATWLMQNGVDKWEAAGFLGMSVEMLDRVYGHHHPDHLAGLPCRSATAEPNHWQYRWQQHDGHGCQRNKALKRLVGPGAPTFSQ